MFLCLLCFPLCATENPKGYCKGKTGLMYKTCVRWNQIWHDGTTDLLISGYAWHNRYTYTAEKVKTYNEFAYGGGIGRTIIDEDGDMQGYYAMVFADSHEKAEPIAGYVFIKNWTMKPETRIGIGLSAFITARPDINKGNPFPGALPLAAFQYKRATVFATYIPGAKGAGNVLYIFGKWQLTD